MLLTFFFHGGLSLKRKAGENIYIYIVANINIVTVRIKSIVYNYLYQHD